MSTMCKEERNKKVEENIGLAYSCSFKIWDQYQKYCLTNYIGRDDLQQIALVGLLKAVDKFDETRGFKFSTYAVPIIKFEILRFLRDKGSLIKIRVNNTSQKEKYDLDRKLVDSRTNMISLNQTYSNSDGDKDIAIENMIGVEEDYDAVLDNIVLQDAIEELSEKEKKIIYMYYFQEKTQLQIAKILGTSQKYISITLAKTLKDLRLKLA